MHNYAYVAVDYLFMLGGASFAYKHGGTAERFGAMWYALNTCLSAAMTVFSPDSPTAHLVSDGTFAIGILPLAMIYVSYEMGLIALISAALFSLEAVYLINDRPADLFYAWSNNVLCLLIPIVFWGGGFIARARSRRAGAGPLVIQPKRAPLSLRRHRQGSAEQLG